MPFYERRKGSGYYKAAKQLIEAEGHCESILDIGCWDAPVVTWGTFDNRYTVDAKDRPIVPGVMAIVGYWPEARIDLPCDKVDVTVCLQTLEHIEDARSFAEAIFDVTRKVAIISVPWKWPAGTCKQHIHEPIDWRKLLEMTGRKYNSRIMVGGKRKRAVFSYRMD